jgi:hypothetical protein
VGNSRTFQFATAGVLVLNLLAVSGLGADAAKPGGYSGGSGSSGNASCVAVSGGTSINTTTLDVVADGGTAITDSSGGSGNLASGGGDGGGRNNNNHHNNNNNHNNNNHKNHFSSMSVQEFEDRLMQTETTSSGNGGVSNASANGGAIQIGDVNSGGNAGNAIEVGDTHCAAAPYNAPGGGGGGKAGGAGTIRALPSTGAGVTAAGPSSSLLSALAAVSLLVLSLGVRPERRLFRLGSR